MKAADIIRQLWLTLPRYTNLFSDDIAISSLTRSGTTVTAITTAPHGLTTGMYAYIYGAQTPITVTSLTQVNNIATAITASNHDYTEHYQDNVNISEAIQPEYNGLHPLLTVPNRRTFTYSITGNPTSPATGTIKTIQDIKHGYNGLYQITKIDNITFTYQITSSPESPAQGTIIARSNIRITGANGLDRATQSYTKQAQSKLYAFVVLDNVTASKDRFTFTDATYTNTTGQDFRQRVIEPFSIFVFMPTADEIAGLNTRDLMQDLAQPIFKSILRFKFDSIFTDETNFGIIFTEHQFIGYTPAYYIHEFKFENQYDITYDNTVDSDDSVAFRDIDLKFNSDLNSIHNQIMHTNVDLDDQPL
jgi:hypothetical protein